MSDRTATSYPAESEEHYEVEYTYYRYNSGDGRCGEYRARRTTPSAAAAAELAEKVNVSAARNWENSDEEAASEQDLLDGLLPSHGFFLGARAYRVQTERTPLTAIPVIPRR